MTTNIFNIAAADVQRNLFPSSAGRRFSIGDTASDELTTSELASLVLISTDRLVSMLPRQYRTRLTEVDGEYLCKRALGGETQFTLSLFPATNVKLFKNFTPIAQWSRRGADYLVPESTYTVNLTTGVITLDSALAAGDSLIACYNHTAAEKMLFLRDCVAKFTAIDIARSFNFFKNPEEADRFELMQADVNRYLNGLHREPDKGIPMIDDIDLVDQDTDDYSNEFWKEL